MVDEKNKSNQNVCSQPCKFLIEINKDLVDIAKECGKASQMANENKKSIEELYKDRNQMVKENAIFGEQLKNIDKQLSELKSELKESMDSYTNKIDKINNNMENKLDEFKEMLSSDDKDNLSRYRKNFDTIVWGVIIGGIVGYVLNIILNSSFKG